MHQGVLQQTKLSQPVLNHNPNSSSSSRQSINLNITRQQLDKFHTNMNNAITLQDSKITQQDECIRIYHKNQHQHQNQNKNYLFENSDSNTPQIYVHQVDSISSQRKIEQNNYLHDDIDINIDFDACDQNQNKHEGEFGFFYNIKVIQVEYIKSLQQGNVNVNDYQPNNQSHRNSLFSDKNKNDSPDNNKQDEQKQKQTKKSCNDNDNHKNAKNNINKQNSCKGQTKLTKNCFQTRYHQRIPSKVKLYQNKQDLTIMSSTEKLKKKIIIRKTKPTSKTTQLSKNKQNRIALSDIYNNSNMNYTTSANLSTRPKNKSSNKKTTQIPHLIINRSKLRETLDLEPQMSLTGPVQKMKQILEDRNYNIETAITITDKQNIGHVNRKIIKKSPYGLLQIIVRNQKNLSSLSKITNLRILKPGQFRKLHKKSRIKCLQKKTQIQTLDQFLSEQDRLKRQFQRQMLGYSIT